MTDHLDLEAAREVFGVLCIDMRSQMFCHTGRALISEVERLQALVERAAPFVTDSLNFTGSPWCGSDEARGWLVDATAALSESPTETKGENG